MKLTVVSVIAFFISTPVFAQDSGAIGFGTVAEAYAALRKDAKAEFLIQEGWVIAKVTGGPHSGVWSFTPNTHPAHPAVIKRFPTENGGQIAIRMQALCGGPKPACDQLVEHFKKLNEQVARDIQQRKGGK